MEEKQKIFVPLAKKAEILDKISEGMLDVSVQEIYGVSKRTIQRWKKAGRERVELWKESKDKRIGQEKYKEVNKFVYEKFLELRSLGIPLTGCLLQHLALRKSKELANVPQVSRATKQKYESATFGCSWVDKFKQRYCIKSIRVNGERLDPSAQNESIDVEMQKLRNVISDLELSASQVYNWDETALYFRGSYAHTLVSQNDTGGGNKQDKSRITVLVQVNGDGSDITASIIGKSKTPHNTGESFWNSNNTRYFHNKAGWMTMEIWEKLLLSFDNSVSQLTMLLVDNFSGHGYRKDLPLKNVLVYYLPKNSTSKCQPLDAGIIACFKCKYRLYLSKFVVEQQLLGQFKMNQVTLHKATPWIMNSIRSLNPVTIMKCFYKTIQHPIFNVNADDEQINQDFGQLHETMEMLVGTKLATQEVHTYITMDNFKQNTKLSDHQSETKEIAVTDHQKMLKYLKELKEYSETVSLHSFVQPLAQLEDKICDFINQ